MLLDAPHGAIFLFKNSWRERDWPIGPRIGYSRWELDYPYRCWEINWPKRAISGLKQALLGLQDFEYAEWMASHPGCH